MHPTAALKEGVTIFNSLTLSPVDIGISGIISKKHIFIHFEVPDSKISLHLGAPDNCPIGPRPGLEDRFNEQLLGTPKCSEIWLSRTLKWSDFWLLGTSNGLKFGCWGPQNGVKFQS